MLNRLTTILIIVLALLAASFYWLVWPAWNNLSQAKNDLASWVTKVESVQQYEKDIISLVEKYKDPEKAEMLLAALPREEDREGLLVQLESLASENGLILGSVGFSAVDSKGDAVPVAASMPSAGSPAGPPAADVSAAEQTKSNDLKTISLTLKLSGDIAGLRNFLLAVENNLRIMDVASIDFEVGDMANNQESLDKGIDFQIKLKTYYRDN